MDNPIILVTFIMVVMTGIAIIAVIVVLKKRRAELARLEAGVGSGNIPDSEPAGFPRKGAGEHEGVAFSYHYHPGSKNSPSSYTVQVAHPSPVTFKISKESGFDRFAEKLGLNVELKTGDPVFDETFYITSTDTDYMRMVLDSSTNRRLVSEIHEIGFTSIILTRKELKAVWTPFRARREFDHATLNRVAGLLVKLHTHLPEVLMIGRNTDTGWRSRRIAAFVIPIAAVLIGMFALIFGLTRYSPLDGWRLALSSLPLSVPALLLFIYFAFVLLRGRSSSHREFLLVVLLALPGFLLAGAGGKIFTNGWLDSSPAVTHQVEVASAWITTDDEGDETYHIEVRSWRPERVSEHLRVTGATYRQVDPGRSLLAVTTHRGKWGYEWVADYAVR